MTGPGTQRPFASAATRVAFTVLAVLVFLMAASVASGGQATVNLGTADSYAVLGGSTVTNTGPTVVNGDLGVSPGSAVTGFPPGLVNGTIHAADAAAAQAQSDVTIAYNDAAGRACDVNLTGQDLGGLTLVAGANCFSSSAQLTGTVTLDAQGDSSAVFIFQIGTSLTTASSSRVSLVNGAQGCNVFWQVGSSATLGTTTDFKGTILALQSITLTTGATMVRGRALARNGAVTMDTNTITRATCAGPPPTPSPSPSPSAPPPTPSPSPSAPPPTPSPSPSAPPPTPSPSAPPPTPSPSPRPTPTQPPTPAPTPTLPPTTAVLGSGDIGGGPTNVWLALLVGLLAAVWLLVRPIALSRREH